MTTETGIQLRVIAGVLWLLLASCAVAEDAADEVEVKGATLGRMGDSAVVDPATYEFAVAEKKLWLDNHLQNISSPGRLYYDFVKRGTFEQGFSDSVYLDILGINEDGSKNADLAFFTAERQQSVRRDNLVNVTGNPVLTIYMQGDVYEMNRLTEGSWRYFQRRIKSAFAEGATIEPVTFEYDGGQVDGEKISITPYINDPRRRQFAAFAPKVYEFILSEQVPGKIYQIKTVIPGAAPDQEPLIEEILTLQSAEFTN
ncbi:MAG: hypothetical protein OXD47_07810 [Gammaproteobacteria bacterium]|nr:hypothetical protein [Gammaproteobacteria bacterium]MCY4283448.1 hypothetical protein [Gammaproteobacteria bacterium]MCY4338688.1 hypothetical protein [Gammaproteobacteria bacterium]